LSPIVLDPATARPLPGIVSLLERLAARFAIVAVVSGRPARILVERLDLDHPESHVRAFGLYGLEPVDAGGRIGEPPGAKRWRSVIATVAHELTQMVPDPASVEEKGLGVVLHWRRNPEREPELLAVAEAAAARHHLELHRGRRSVELLPPLGLDKGSVVRSVSASLETACFLGDDLGDLAAFQALGELRAEGLHTVAIAIASAEMPPGLAEEADLVLDGPQGAARFLQSLADRIEELEPTRH
jgi:trehalose 6-phosphate phosphatase